MIKKVLFGVCVAAVVVLAAVNVNFAINSKSKVNVTLEGMISRADSESGGGGGDNCKQKITSYDMGYWVLHDYTCDQGTGSCQTGTVVVEGSLRIADLTPVC